MRGKGGKNERGGREGTMHDQLLQMMVTITM